MSWYFLSIVFHKGTLGRMLFLSGLVGLLLTLIEGNRREKRFAIATLALMAAMGAAGIATVYLDFWRGPSLLYFEFFLWPLYVMFAVRGLAVVLLWISRRSSMANGLIARCSEAPLALFVFLPLVLALVVAGLARTGSPGQRAMFPLPPSETRIVSFLKDRI